VLNGERTEGSANKAQDGGNDSASRLSSHFRDRRIAFSTARSPVHGACPAQPGVRPVVLRPVHGPFVFFSSSPLERASHLGFGLRGAGVPARSVDLWSTFPEPATGRRRSSQQARGLRRQCRFRTQTGTFRNTLTFYTSGSNM
jgi:hypothetical protein